MADPRRLTRRWGLAAVIVGFIGALANFALIEVWDWNLSEVFVSATLIVACRAWYWWGYADRDDLPGEVPDRG